MVHWQPVFEIIEQNIFIAMHIALDRNRVFSRMQQILPSFGRCQSSFGAEIPCRMGTVRIFISHPSIMGRIEDICFVIRYWQTAYGAKLKLVTPIWLMFRERKKKRTCLRYLRISHKVISARFFK